MLTPATIGILAASAAAGRFARRHPQRWLIIAGFLVTAVGMLLLLALVRAHSGIWRWIPGLLLFGAGIGTMLTSSVNVVQSSFPDSDQGDISGLSRSVSNLGSSLGTALVGSVLVAVKTARRKAVRCCPDDAARDRPHRPGPRRPHPPPAGRGHRTTIPGGRICARNAGRLGSLAGPVSSSHDNNLVFCHEDGRSCTLLLHQDRKRPVP